MSEAKKIVHDGKKNALGIVFGSAEDDDKDNPHDADGEDEDYGSDEDEKAALDEAFDAVKKGDKEGFCEAMQSAMRICYANADKEEDEEEEHEE